MGIMEAKRALEIRLTLSKSSTKKYQALVDRASRIERVRDIALYHGAHTGRESGTGLQLQNLPRGSIKDTFRAIDDIKGADLKWLHALYGDVMELFSSVIRGMVTSSPGYTLYAADYNAIEARVLAWIAGDNAALQVFKSGLDPYKKNAAAIFSKHIEDVTDDERQIGKLAELGLGYGMGPDKFLKTCHSFRIMTMTPELAEKTVKVYRTLHSPIVKFWRDVDQAAVRAVKAKTKVKVGRVSFEGTEKYLALLLPSGRRIYYQRPEVRIERTPWGDKTARLYFWGVDSLTKKWSVKSAYGGLLTENIVQAASRDIMVEAMIRADRAGYSILFAVHDEVVSESKEGNLEKYEQILMTLPPWALGLPLKAKGYEAERYKKG